MYIYNYINNSSVQKFLCGTWTSYTLRLYISLLPSYTIKQKEPGKNVVKKNSVFAKMWQNWIFFTVGNIKHLDFFSFLPAQVSIKLFMFQIKTFVVLSYPAGGGDGLVKPWRPVPYLVVVEETDPSTAPTYRPTPCMSLRMWVRTTHRKKHKYRREGKGRHCCLGDNIDSLGWIHPILQFVLVQNS